MGCYSSHSVFERILDNICISLLWQGSYLLNTYENDLPGRVNLLPSSLPGKESWLLSSRGSAFQELGYHAVVTASRGNLYNRCELDQHLTRWMKGERWLDGLCDLTR